MKVMVQSVCVQWGCDQPRKIRLWCERCYQQWRRAESIYQCLECGHTYTGHKHKCDAYLTVLCGKDSCKGHQQMVYGCVTCRERYYSYQQFCTHQRKVLVDSDGAFEMVPCGSPVKVIAPLTCGGTCRKIGSHIEHWTVHDSVQVIRYPERMPECSEPGCCNRSRIGRDGRCGGCYHRMRRNQPDIKARQQAHREKWASKPENKVKIEAYRNSQAYKDAQTKASIKYRNNPVNKRHQRLRDRAKYLTRKHGTTKQSVVLTP